MIRFFDNKFSLNFLKVCVLAWEIAKDEYIEKNKTNYDITNKEALNNVLISPKHLFFAISIFPTSLAFSVLNKFKKINKIFDANLDNRINASLVFLKNDFSLLKNKFDVQTRDIVNDALMIATSYDHYYVGTEHLLYCLLKSDNKELFDILKTSGINVDEVIKNILQILKSISNFSNFANNYAGGLLNNQKNPALDFFTTDLTDEVIQEDIDPVIMRDKEIERVIYILSRRYKNNPILLGNAGVGKTAIVEGLAKKIMNNEVPDTLIGKKILKLDLNSVVAGASFRGEFEVRIKDIIEEVESDPNIILFIDEVHTIVGAGSNNNNQDAANILKPALAKGKIRVIGATTYEEYKQYIEKDAALERRFQPIFVDEPNEEDTIKLLQGIKKHYENFHNVKIDDESIYSAVSLSKRYITDKYLPDKAIDLIDEACSRVKVKNYNSDVVREIIKIENKINLYEIERSNLIDKEDFKGAVVIKNKEEDMSKKLEYLKFKVNEKTRKKYGVVKKEDIAKIVSDLVSIPVDNILSNNILIRINTLKDNLEKELIGQKDIIENIVTFIKRGVFESNFKNKPIASFIFSGPSGVGKTEAANIIAKSFFDSEANLLRFDMSEFSESIGITALIGAPAGYVGYREGGSLTDSVKKKPYSVILFENADKAHAKVLSLLSEILDTGFIKDATGRLISFKNSVVIFSSTIEMEELSENDDLGFGSEGKKEDEDFDNNYAKDILKDYFSYELINKVDKILIFKDLKKEDLINITKIKLQNLKKFLPKDSNISFTDKVVKKIVDIAIKDKINNARGLDEVITEKIENNLIDLLMKIDNSNKNVKKIEIDFDKKFIIKKSE